MLARSKQVISERQDIVDEHKAYDEELKATEAWLSPLEQNLQTLKKEEIGGNLDAKGSRLQVLLAEKEQAEHRLSKLIAAGEKVLPNTSAQGREQIRQELRKTRERWDNLNEGILEQQKKQDAQSIQWTNYQENLQQILTWLNGMERTLKQDSGTGWSSLQEVRSKLLKNKAIHQEILSHKRIIEGVSEKANALAQLSQARIDHQKVDSILQRYKNLVETSQKGISNLESVLDFLQQFYDLQKSYQAYQKQQWESLGNYSDSTGNKAALQARLLKIIEIQDNLSEGEVKLNVLEKHVTQNVQTLSPRSQESMERDLTNLKLENKKFANAVSDAVRNIEERIQQWSEYENSLERLLLWLSEAECSLKNYCLKNTIEEKQEQLEKYQVRYLIFFFLIEIS